MSMECMERINCVMPDQLKSVKVEQEIIFDEKQQMRFLMANAAHDLKTPLASFTMGMDVIRQMVVDMEAKISQLKVPNPRLQEMLVTLKSQLTAMEAQSQYMTMTINRCMDYTKITNGTELTCHPETIEVLESLQRALLFIPLVLGEELSHISVSLDPLPASICTYIITDARWLQENLLCLVEQSKAQLLRILRESPALNLSLTIRLSLEADNSNQILSPSPSVPYRMSPVMSSSSPIPSTRNQTSNHLHFTNQHQNSTNRNQSSPQHIQSLIPRRPAGASPSMQSSRAVRSKLSQSLRYLSANDEPSVQTSTINFIQEDTYVSPSEKVVVGESFPRTPVSTTSSPSSFQTFSSPVPGHRLRLEVVLSTYIPEMKSEYAEQPIATNGMSENPSDCSPFQNSKSHAEMNLVNFQARLRSLKGHGGRYSSVEENTSIWYFTIPYRPDVARQQIRASFLRGNSWRGDTDQYPTDKSVAKSTSSSITTVSNMRTPITFSTSSTSTSGCFLNNNNQTVIDSLDSSLTVPQIGLTLSSESERGDFIPSLDTSFQQTPYTSYYQPHMANSVSSITSNNNSTKYPYIEKESSTIYSDVSSIYGTKKSACEEQSDVPVSPRFIDINYHQKNSDDAPNSSTARSHIVGGTALSTVTSCAGISEMDTSFVSPLALAVAAQQHASIESHMPKPPIYLVDDSTLVLKLTRTVLERSGYVVQVAKNGLEAVQTICNWIEGLSAFSIKNSETEVEAAANSPLPTTSKHSNKATPMPNNCETSGVFTPSNQTSPTHVPQSVKNIWEDVSLSPVVLMDLQMPVLDGIEAVRRIRSCEEKKFQEKFENLNETTHNKLVILALSANNHDDIVQEALAAGCDAFLQKPFNLEDFQQVMYHIEMYRTQDASSQQQ